MSQERIAYMNGTYLPESQVVVSFRDRSFKYGDGVFDSARTFGGRIFKLEEHVARLYASLRYARIEIELSPAELIEISQEIVLRNLPTMAEGEDCWVTQRISRGVDLIGGEFWQSGGPTVIVECTPLPLKARAPLYRDGMVVWFPSVQRIPPQSLSPNVKSHNYLNMIVADLEVRSHTPDAWAVLLDTRGFLAEGMGSNIFLVKDGVLYTPKADYVLAGISRETVFELAAAQNLVVVEDDLSPYDAYTADEVFITSTSLCICPVISANGITIGEGKIPGPITRQLWSAYADLLDFDFVEQYTRHLDTPG